MRDLAAAHARDRALSGGFQQEVEIGPLREPLIWSLSCSGSHSRVGQERARAQARLADEIQGLLGVREAHALNGQVRVVAGRVFGRRRHAAVWPEQLGDLEARYGLLCWKSSPRCSEVCVSQTPQVSPTPHSAKSL